MFHLRSAMGSTRATGHVPLAVAMQDAVNVEDAQELLKEARGSIIDVRKVRVLNLIITIEDLTFSMRKALI